MNLRGAKPVVDYAIRNYITDLNPMHDLYNEELPEIFIRNFIEWISNSKNNSLLGIKNYKNAKLCAGTAQAFDHFYWRHKDKRFRIFKNEFMYHSAVLKHGGRISYLDNFEESFSHKDAVILSVPFSDTGSTHKDLEYILQECNNFSIPVLLDFAYYPCTKNIKIDLNLYPCVETLTFSISKAFYGGEFLRVGLRLEKVDTDDGIDVFNSVEMINRLSISVANSLINKYTVDYNWNTYSDAYKLVCEEMNLEPTDCIMFGLGGEEYKELNRGGTTNRVCISECIGEKINGGS